MNRFWGLKLLQVKSAQFMTDEGREMTGEMAGGLGGLAAGTAALEGVGQMTPALRSLGGYGPALMKVLRGEAGHLGGAGKSMPARLALALLMGLPYGVSMSAGQGLGGHIARQYNVSNATKE